jgi:Mycobacterium 19 kDa lipoprotein antigen
MTFSRHALSVAGLAAALALSASGCSGGKPSDTPEKTGETPAGSGVTTVDLTLNAQPVDLAGAALKCYDFQGHLMVEAYNSADREATHFLMDYYQNQVSLSIGVRGGHPDLYDYEQGKAGQAATVTRNGNSVSVTGTIGVALNDTTPPRPFAIKANCAKFFDTPPDSSGG